MNTTSIRLRQLADRMGLDGFAEELREIAGELEAKAVPSRADQLVRKYIECLTTNDSDGASDATKSMVDYVFNCPPATAHEAKAAPAVPRGIPAQEVIDAIEAWKSAWLKVPPFADRVNKATREAITISHNSLFLLLQSAQQAQRMPAGCTTPTGCGPHGCHGACIAATPAAPSQEPVTRPQNCGTSFCSCIECVCEPEPVTLTEDEIDANTVWFDPDPHDNVHCDVHATVNKCIAALREKQGGV